MLILPKCVETLLCSNWNGLTGLTVLSMEDNNRLPEMIVIAGPNGSGKTSVTQKFLHHEWAEGTLYINPDEIAKDVFGDRISADGRDAKLLFRLVDGKLKKRYVKNVPEWAQVLLP